MGEVEVRVSALADSSVKYHSVMLYALTGRQTLSRQYLVGSFSGALSSQKVTEECIKVL